jgi:Lrp/AsnC family leucine-responsive transcriptional regulator
MATPSRCDAPVDAIDAVDAQLLRLLQADGRISITRLAEAVGLAAATVHERVARLKREGYILGYEAILNPAKLNSGLLVFAEIRVNDATPALARALKAAVHAREEVIECHEVAGNFDYLIKTRVPDMDGYREFMNTVVWSLPGVREVRTYAVIDEVKSTSCIPL